MINEIAVWSGAAKILIIEKYRKPIAKHRATSRKYRSGQ
jgi:hypothetical protein